MATMRKPGIGAIVLATLIVLPGAASTQLTAPSASSFGLAGSFAARARGYEASYWNPANLGLPGAPGWSVGIVGANATINNNSLDRGQITGLFGEFIDNETKSTILADIRRGPDRFRLGGELGASALAASIGRFGFGFSAIGVGDLHVSPDAAELGLQQGFHVPSSWRRARSQSMMKALGWPPSSVATILPRWRSG